MNTILFDLDGTLLPMDQEAFIKIYFKNLIMHFVPKGISKEKLLNGMTIGTNAMLANDGSTTNEQCFWKTFEEIMDINMNDMEPDFYNFYETGFQEAKNACTASEHAAKCIKKLKDKNYKIVIATNPLFPPVATLSRIAWAGLDPNDFEHITTYDNSSYCKPKLGYYLEILKKIGKTPEECMMVGNDIEEDMCAKELGLDTYLLTDCLINPNNLSTEDFKSGSFKDLESFIDSLPVVEI